METIPAAQAIEVLIHEYGKLVYNTIYDLTGDWEESQDLTQDTFVQALRAIDAEGPGPTPAGDRFSATSGTRHMRIGSEASQERR